MIRNILLFVILANLLISGCAQTAIPETSMPTSMESAGEWTVNMTYSGGIMGLSRSIEIASDGTFTAADARENKTVIGKLGAEDWSKLNELLAVVKEPADKPGGMICADCFVYDLEIHGDGKRFAIHLDDTSLPASGCEPLISHLRELMTTALE